MRLYSVMLFKQKEGIERDPRCQKWKENAHLHVHIGLYVHIYMYIYITNLHIDVSMLKSIIISVTQFASNEHRLIN